jgi:hypothetical protein
VKSPVHLILGCGRFGRRAVQTLARHDFSARILVVDQYQEALREISHLAVEPFHGDAVHVLDRILSSNQRVDYIIPAVPFHLAFEFLLLKLRPRGATRIEVPALRMLPHATRGKTGDVYTSFADFLCPEDCNEPVRCTVTGRRRVKSLFKVLADLSGPLDSRVLRSRQLAPGVGGFRMSDLLRLLGDLELREIPHRPVLIGTACRCHGVISALCLGSRPAVKSLFRNRCIREGVPC